MIVACKFFCEGSFRSEILTSPTLANFSDFLQPLPNGLQFLWIQTAFSLRPDFEVHSQRQFLARRDFSKLVVGDMLNSWVIPPSGRKWIGKVRIKWKKKKKQEKILYEKSGSIPSYLCLDSCQMSDRYEYDNMVYIRQPISLLLCSVKYIHNNGWSATLWITLYMIVSLYTYLCAWSIIRQRYLK